MRFSLIFFSALCASLAIAADSNDTTCLGNCFKDIVTSGNQTQELLKCAKTTNITEELQCFCNSDDLINQLSGCVQNNCEDSVYDAVQKTCAQAGVQLPDAPENAAVAAESASLVLFVTTGLAVMTLL